MCIRDRNSWGSVQTGLNLETARGISDYIKDNFQDIWQPQEDDVVYTVLDLSLIHIL